jgi:peptidoglycan/xylan/chitin deacetylase (PgdA/CDA1 family)
VTADRSIDRRSLLSGLLGTALLAGCAAAKAAPSHPTTNSSSTARSSPAAPRSTAPRPGAPTSAHRAALKPATPAQIITRATVPALCWHQLRDWRPSDGAFARNELICPPRSFRAQLDALNHDGWTTISPDQYLTHLTTGATLPPKPVILTFDDSQASQISEGLPHLLARGMTATFFLMTVVFGNQGWMTTRDVKHLAEEGMTVAAHTWDHHRVDRYSGSDWKIQLDQPKALLEKLIGRAVEHFAYPYGLWNRGDFPHLAAAGYRTAFKLRQFPMDRMQPLYSLRRIIVVSTWTGPELLTALTQRR